MNKIKKNDHVIVNCGNYKGTKGKVISVRNDRVLVEGVNMVKKHIKSNPNKQINGSISSMESFIHISNFALYEDGAKKYCRTGIKFLEIDNKRKKVRYFKVSGNVLD